MIDCVFLLLIFFVLVIDLSQNQLEDLILPAAKHALADDPRSERRPIVNITQDGRIVHRRTVLYDPARDGDDLGAVMAMLAAATREREPTRTAPEPVLVRADKWTPWEHVARFMHQCSRSGLSLRLDLALSERDREGRGQ
jgi:biopolymer transport protein ExbD